MIGNKIKLARKKAGLTQKELAELIDKGFSTVQKYELGIITPSFPTLGNIAKVVGVSVWDLINVEDDYLFKSDEEKTQRQLVRISEKLNIKGQQKTIDYMVDLAGNPDYRKAED